MIEDDRGASSVLCGEVDEFVNKGRETRDRSASSGGRDAGIDLEPAADRATAAAEADDGAAHNTVEAIRQAHLKTYVLKTNAFIP